MSAYEWGQAFGMALVVLWLSAIPVGIGLIVLICRWNIPKAPKPAKAPTPKPPVTQTRPPDPQYIRRWGLHRKHSVAAEKAEWEKDFSRVAPPSATAPERDRASTPPSVPPPAPKTPDEVFTGLRKRLSDLA